MPWPQNSRTTEQPAPSAKAWIAWPMSPSRAPGAHLHDAVPHRLVGELAQALRGDRAGADDEHAARVAVPAVLDDGDVDVDDVAVLQRPLVGDAVADLVVDRGADRLRVRLVARGRVVQRRGDGLLHVDDVVVRQAVELFGRDAGLDVLRQHVQHLGGEPPGNAHGGDLLGRLDGDRHGGIMCKGRVPAHHQCTARGGPSTQ